MYSDDNNKLMTSVKGERECRIGIHVLKKNHVTE